jgi:uncharacterized protein (DUF885 family)
VVLAVGGGCTPTSRLRGVAEHAAAEERRFEALVTASDEAALRLAPMNAVSRGDLRFADQFGDLVSDDYFRVLEQNARADLAQVRSIDRNALSPNAQIAYDVFLYQTEVTVKSFDSGAQRILAHMPLDHYTGLHIAFPQWSSGDDVAPFNTLADYEDGLSRLEGFARYLEAAQVQMRHGIEAGHVLPRGATERLLEQLDETIAGGVDESPLLRPTADFPDAIAAVERQRLTAAYRHAISTRLMPTIETLRAFLATEYLAASRTGSPGLSSMPGGAELYAYWLEQHTTTRLTADEIHQMGIAEVARIQQEMEQVRVQVGFDGSLEEFFVYLRTDARFKPPSADALLDGYRAVYERVQPTLPRLFSSLPRGSFEVRAVPNEQENSVGGAYYVLGAPDGSRPGVFYANTSNLASRTSPAMTALFLHEAMPGHHLQGTLTQENETLPAFLRFGWNTGFGEGWALYAESLGTEIGLYADPYQYFGRLDLEMFRALRLVVDTGLHARHWGRQQAIDYMLAHSSLDLSYIEQEVDRYIAWPGQATAYKVGEIVIQRLRRRAESAFGARFDVRAFHEQVLNTGCLPLQVLEQKIDRWIAASR